MLNKLKFHRFDKQNTRGTFFVRVCNVFLRQENN